MRAIRWTVLLCMAGCTTRPAGTEGPLAQADTPPVQVQETDDLGRAYATLRAAPTSASAQRGWFNVFPAGNAALRSAFGFEEITADSVVFGPHYEQGSDMIFAFFALDSIPAHDIAAKAVGVAKDGEWQEDGVGYFQHHLARHLEQESAVYLAVLDGLPANEQAGFWRFFTDGPEPYPAEDRTRLRALLSRDPRQLTVLDSVLALPR